MKPLNQIISEKTDEALNGYALKGQVTFHDNDLPDGVTLSERFSIYLKENSFAIKQEIFDPDGYGQPSVTNLTKHLTSDQVVLEMRTYIQNDQREAKVNNKPFTSLEQLNNLVDTNTHILKPTAMESTPTSKSASAEKQEIQGYIGTKGVRFTEIPESKQRIANLSVRSNKNDPNEYTKVVAFNATADILKNAIENEQIKWVKLEGAFRDQKPYTDKNNKVVQPGPEFVVSEVKERSKTVELNGNIGFVKEQTTTKGKPYTHVFVINNTNVGGVKSTEEYNISVFKESAKLGEGVELAVSKPIAIKGEMVITRRPDKTTGKIVDSANITAWNIEKTPTLLKEKIESLQAAAADKKKSGPEKETKSESKETTKEQKPKKAPAKSAKAKKEPGIEM